MPYRPCPSTSVGHQQFAFNVAKRHADVVFEHAGGWMQAPNFGNFFGATQAAWFAMGVAAMTVAPFGAAMPADVGELVTAAADRIGKGFNPFTGPVTDNTGAVRIKEGESWGGDKMGSFDWYAEGVIGKAK
jgi:basic membrane lipoprotein Med (substrate-binding protein (PBP1-ABC) superfamily)